jgi:hypothetical protein
MTALSLVPPAEPRSPLRAIALVAFAIFTMGTTLYALGVTAWSGRHVASFDVQQGAVVPLPGAITWSHTGPRAHEVGPVKLDPSMNPARVLAHVDYRPAGGRTPSCRVTMRDAGGHTAWSENRDFGTYAAGRQGSKSRSTTLVIETFDIARAGDYTFVVDLGPDGPDAAAQSFQFEVRSRVASVQAWFVVVGALLAFASLVVVLLTAPRSAGADGRGSRAA